MQTLSKSVECDRTQQPHHTTETLQQLPHLQIGESAICKNWLKHREGRPLSHKEVQQYEQIVMMLQDIDHLMEDIQDKIQSRRLQNQQIFAEVQVIIVDKLGVELEKVTPKASFANDLGTDSLDTIELIQALEDTFKIKFSQEFMGKLLTVQQIIDHIVQKVAVAV